MSWIQKLYETYENCRSMIGVGSDDNEVPLLPICHTTQKAQIEITIDQEGNFIRARVVPKEEARTIVPCTETSGGRTGSKPETHPLCDKLQYIAGDFLDYGGEVTSGYAKNPREPHERYKEILRKWCESEYSHPKAKAVLKHIEKGNVIKDLVDHQILCVGTDGRLLKKWDNKTDEDIPEIFKVLSNSDQADAFVRWIVEIPNNPQAAVWNDSSLFESWIRYYSANKDDSALCYVTGTELPAADQHPAKLRNDGDKAKLISSNDTSGFTFRGRFSTAGQACGVGFEVTQKAHNALRWLISRQGYKRGDQAIVAWAVSGKEIPDPMTDSFSILGMDVM
ncbi:MAG: type I-C CRISPR-associated protein Cas8c/Csd1, partial [Bacteroidota bacterium]